jgi:hypothetical protein
MHCHRQRAKVSALVAEAAVYRGWSLAKFGKVSDGIEQIQQASSDGRPLAATWPGVALYAAC